MSLVVATGIRSGRRCGGSSSPVFFFFLRLCFFVLFSASFFFLSAFPLSFLFFLFSSLPSLFCSRVFLPSLPLFSFVLPSPLFLFFFRVSFSSSLYLFFLLFFLFFSVISPLCSLVLFFLLLPSFYRQKQGRMWLGRPLCCRPITAPPTCGKWVGKSASFWEGSWWEIEVDGGDRGRKKNLLFPLLRASKGRRKATVSFKTAPFRAFFFNSVWNGGFGQNAPFHLNENGANWCQNTKQSSICDLFNRVLNCKFWFKNQCNCTPAKNPTAALKLAAFSKLILGL